MRRSWLLVAVLLVVAGCSSDGEGRGDHDGGGRDDHGRVQYDDHVHHHRADDHPAGADLHPLFDLVDHDKCAA